ncbi:hypothetical protein LPB85_06125 [Chryseobacterium sp. LC2016-27]|uniref:hypothetical protein n=1 Tax=unclassified Chryseobacterium TaxID=2593645 RepID=UPI001E4063BC|nr:MULTISPECIES: hypothetical protein [unclassified Chryseobacterium]MCD0455022.1 hypothetical protein [Chryseobacterium sp. LC2016-27]MCD0480822.1 hypothetical protein [Chryseobacterium sp. LC2016-29]
MKQFYKSKNLLRLSFLATILFSTATVFNSCKDDDEDEFQDHLVQFEAKIVNGGTAPTPPVSTFKTIITQVGTKQEQLFDSPGLLWTSGEFFVNSSQSQLNFAANANLLNADSKLIVSIYIDGEVAETDTIEGSGTKHVAVAHSFLEL